MSHSGCAQLDEVISKLSYFISRPQLNVPTWGRCFLRANAFCPGAAENARYECSLCTVLHLSPFLESDHLAHVFSVEVQWLFIVGTLVCDSISRQALLFFPPSLQSVHFLFFLPRWWDSLVIRITYEHRSTKAWSELELHHCVDSNGSHYSSSS